MIRTALPADLPSILSVYAAARTFMANNGNPTQWQNGFPPAELLEKHIASQKLFLVTDNDVIHGCFYFAVENDETYTYISDGSWLSSEPYGVIHLVASDGETHGFFRRLLTFCEAQIPHLRIDTHQDNKIMQHIVTKHGFSRCGIIHLADGSPRIAYEKLPQSSL